MAETVALLGGGVIGGGWAARFVLNGFDARLYDPAPDAARVVDEMLANARRAYRRLTLAPLPAEGKVTLVETPEEAVAGAVFVQESAPEREGLKRDLLAAASRVAGPSTVIASSTSGLLPSRLQADMAHPERFTVGHPFNPVYLLPLVELCGGERTAPETLSRAGDVYRALGMRPLIVRREVDAFVADRLLEALWREALWLVADDVATVEEVDDAIRFGAGLRWASMGTFLTYRIAGGKAGMRHFMEQFGPALELPWSKLTDAPELSDELLDKLVAQSDAQAGGRSLRELERLRDDCLVSVIQGLRAHDFGAGAVLAEHERALFAAAPAGAPSDDDAPLRLHTTVVAPEWIDYNGHAHESRYLQVFGDTTDALLRHIGLDLGAGSSYFTVETHLSHLGQARAEERLRTTTQVLGHDEKRLHVFHSLYRTDDDALLATAEQMLLHVDTTAGRAAPAAPQLLARIERIARAHASLPRPEPAGRAIGIPQRDGLREALHVDGPAAEHAGKLMLFGRFVGSWRLEWSGTGPDGAPATMHGELHFSWVLGGRAVQDIWIVPGRGEPGEGRPPLAFHGSTIRFYDASIDGWRSTWVEPVNGRVRRFVGRPVDGDIVLLSDEEEPQLRWRFTDIEADSFRWRAEVSHDGGATWAFDEEMLATRAGPR